MNLFQPPAAGAQHSQRPEITVSDAGPATPQYLEAQQQQHQQQTPQFRTVVVPQGPSSGGDGDNSNSTKNTVYQLTQAQLSPAATPHPDSNNNNNNNNDGSNNNNRPLAPAIKFVGDFQKLLSGQKNDNGDGPTLGFAPTPKLAAEHEAENQKSVKGNVKYQFQVTKLRNWRTGYQRLLVLYEHEFVTLDPDSLAVTNQWSYNNLSSWQALKEDDQILLQVDPDQTKLKFSCHSVPRAAVLTALLECQDQAGLAPNRTLSALDAQRWTRHGTKYAVQLYVKSYGIQEVYQGQPVQIYRYKDIRGVSLAAGNDAAVVLHFRQPSKRRLYEVYSQRGGRSELIRLMQHHCQTLGLILNMEHSLSIQDWIQQRRAVEIGPVLTSWPVTKTTLRPNPSQGIVNRQIAITSRSLLVERASGAVVSCRRLVNLIGLVRHGDSDQISLEYANGARRTYSSPQRDGLIVSILDTASTIGHQIIFSDGVSLPRSLAWQWERNDDNVSPQQGGPNIFAPIAIPVYCLKRVHLVSTRAYAFVAGTLSQLSGGAVPSMVVVKEIHGVIEACQEFNASVPPNGEGLPSGNNDKMVNGAIGALWGLVHALLTVQGHIDGADQLGSRVHERRASEEAAAVLFSSLFRLSNIATGYQKTSELTTFQQSLPEIAGIRDVFAKFWAFRVLSTLVIGLPGDKRDRETEFVNKSVVLKAGGPSLTTSMVESLTCYGKEGGSDLMQMVTSDLLQSLLCSHYDTTTPEHFSSFIRALTENYRSLLATLRSPTPFVLENTALLLQVISSNAPEAAIKVRDAALSSAIILKYFHGAIFSPVEGHRFLSRYLCSLWFSGPMNCPEKRLLKRMVPHGFLAFLNMPGLSKMEQDQLDELERDAIDDNIPEPVGSLETGASGTNTARLRSRIAIAFSQPSNKEQKPENYRIFFHVLTQDHSLPDLIWSQQTRRELRIALETELQYMQRETEARGQFNVAWNYQQFSVVYPSLDNEVKVGNVYMRLWLQAGDGFIRSWEDPAGLFELLFRRLLCVVDRDHNVTIMCIRCMQRLYAIHWSAIGPVPDLMILVHSMATTKSVETQHRLLELVAVLLGVSLTRQTNEIADVPDNAEQMLNSESIGQLCQFAAWGHNTGEKIQSLISRKLTSQSQRKMLSRPSSTGDEQSSTTVQSSQLSPPVWFVASSSKVPPPAESVRGPFTVSDLQKMVSENELTPFDLVTASHAEDYDSNVGEGSHEEHIDTGKWKRLNEVWQLRWFLCMDKADGDGVLSASEVAVISLKSLTRLVELHRSVDSSGTPYIPIPTAKRILSGKDRDVSAANDAGGNPLSILSQSLLCSDASVVEIGANLLCKLLEHNEDTMSKLYLSGVFFFAISYTGSNFSVLARLLHCSHLNQNFQSGFKATAGAENSMRDRSILGSMLPEGLLFVLQNYGFEKFSQVFTGEADTPEVIWNQEMRAHLVEMIRQHLGDFPLRLLQNNTAEYEFCPIPPLSYRKLKNEMFCHNFYLRNLCDEERFADWPIAEPVKVFRACLEKFEESLKNEEESAGADMMGEAVELLGLKDGDGDKELRRRYRTLARQYHPDKNPAGREVFESVQKAYELLLDKVEDGEKIHVAVVDGDTVDKADSHESAMYKMRLLVKAQLLICRRYEADMKKLKYPSYGVLLGCLKIPDAFITAQTSVQPETFINDPWARKAHADFVRAAVELVFRTCVISPQNSTEILAQSGLSILCCLLRGTLNLIKTQKASENNAGADDVETFYEIVLYSLRTLSGILFFEGGRAALIDSEANCDLLMQTIFDCLEGSKLDRTLSSFAEIKQAALDGLAYIAKDLRCNSLVIEFGLLWPLIGCVLLYDSSVENTSTPQTDVSNVSVAANSHAKLAVQVLDGGCVSLLKDSLDTLFTTPLAELLRTKRNSEFLRMVNSNIEEAYMIWNDSMRSQLELFAQNQTRKRSREPGKRSIGDEIECLNEYRYTALLNEIVIGGVYVRVFNKYGTDAVKGINDAAAFGTALIVFATQQMQQLGYLALTEESSENQPEPKNHELLDISVRALKILLLSGSIYDDFLRAEAQLPKLVFSLLNLPAQVESYSFGCDIGSGLVQNQGFADAIVRRRELWRLMHVLESVDGTDSQPEEVDVPKRKVAGWSMLEALSAYGPVASSLVESSCWLELLGVLCGYKNFTTSFYSRVGAAKALSRMLWDTSTSSGLASVLNRFLPLALVTLLRETPEAMVKQFDGDADSPELIWDGEMRSELRSVLSQQLDTVLDDRRSDNMAPFTLDPTVRVEYEKLHNEIFVGGVYVSRFLKDPTYQLQDPTGFLDALLKQREKELAKFWSQSELSISHGSTEIVTNESSDALHDLTTAVVYLCKVRDTLCDKLASWGYMSRSVESIEKALERQLLGSPLMETIRLLHVSARRKANVEAIATISSSDGTHGIVEYTIRAIGGGPLHADAAFFVELLYLVFKNALGDMSRATTQTYNHGYSAVTAPSPAPGEGPVRHNREKISLGDDPLAMFGLPSGGPPSPAVTTPPSQPRPAAQTVRYPSNQSQGVPGQNTNASPYKSQQFAPTQPQSTNQYQNFPAAGTPHSQITSQSTAGFVQPRFHQGNHSLQPSQSPGFRQSEFHQPTRPQQNHGPNMPMYGQQQQHQQQRSSQSPVTPYKANNNSFQQHEHGSGMQQQQPPPVRHQPPLQQPVYQPHKQQGPIQSYNDPLRQTQSAQYQVQQFQQTPMQRNHQHAHLQQQSYSSRGLTSPIHVPQEPRMETSATGSTRQPQTPQVSTPSTHNYGQEPPMSHGNTMPSSGLFDQSRETSSITPRAPPPAAPPPPPPPVPSSPVVETVSNEGSGMSSPLHTSQSMAGASGGIIDARSPTDPSVTAEQRALSSDGAPDAANGRVALLHQALACHLCQFLVNDFLENVSLPEIKDPAAAKVHAINLLKLLTLDPGYGMKFKLILQDIPAWSEKYKSQDHSLLLSTTKRTDYFLTAGEQSNNPTLMLTEGNKEEDAE